jgi:hypothetical protein
VKKACFNDSGNRDNSISCEMGGGTSDERQESVGVTYHWVYRSHCCID